MAEYIEREAAIEAAKKSYLYFGFKAIISSIPAADVQHVVLCRDCKHWDIERFPNYAKENEHFCLMVGLTTQDVWFCADGEKRG